MLHPARRPHPRIVDDVVNTGFSIGGVIAAVRAKGGEVSLAACVCNRGALAPEEVCVERLIALADIRLESWPSEQCPLCRAGVPVNTAYAHGAEYLDSGGNWP